MPKREDPLATGKIYHVFNKTLDGKKIFEDDRNKLYFIELVKYYRTAKVRISYSRLKDLSDKIRKVAITETFFAKYFRVDIFGYCLMPTHFHFLLMQKLQKGTERFIADISNSLTRYFNLKNKRKGPIFLSTFKAVSIKSNEQFIHVSRYIHLNPYSSEIVNSYRKLAEYPWSSYKEYLCNSGNGICNQDTIMNHFKTRERYKKFVEDNADYQRKLEYIKHIKNWRIEDI